MCRLCFSLLVVTFCVFELSFEKVVEKQWLHDFYSIHFILNVFFSSLFCVLLQIDKVHEYFLLELNGTKWDYCGKMETIWAQYWNRSSERRHSIDLNSLFWLGGNFFHFLSHTFRVHHGRETTVGVKSLHGISITLCLSLSSLCSPIEHDINNNINKTSNKKSRSQPPPI